MNHRFVLLFLIGSLCWNGPLFAQKFIPPTANRSIFKLNEQDKYFTGTIGRTWPSGTFGCVRSGGWQMHEGIDIRCQQRDKSGESVDPVFATADGTVVYINSKPSLSNYGNYIILQHRIDGLDVFSTYAHLREIRRGLRAGQKVKAGETIGTLGRTTNTREAISKERAHVHFEVNLFLNDRFQSWYKKTFSNQRNDHGLWNGQNMVGLDPKLVLLQANRLGKDFNLLSFVQNQKELCRVVVRKKDFPWLRRYRSLVHRNPIAEKQGIAGYEISFNYNGLPFRLVPRAASEIKSKATYQLVSVNSAEYKANPCRRIVTPKGKSWELAGNGVRLLDLLTH